MLGHHCRDGCRSCRRYVQRPCHLRKTEIIAADPTNAVAYELRGEAWHLKRDKDRAFEDCSAAIRIDPNFGRAYNCRGRAYSAKGERDRALADYNEAIRLDPGYGPSYTSRALEYFNKRDFDLAITAFTEAVERNPKQAYFAIVMRGEAYAAKGDTDRAVADYDEAMRRIPPPHGPTSCEAPPISRRASSMRRSTTATARSVWSPRAPAAITAGPSSS
ncbi:tetratricopeptide repeat protein [Bradyrhizobium japonicum]